MHSFPVINFSLSHVSQLFWAIVPTREIHLCNTGINPTIISPRQEFGSLLFLAYNLLLVSKILYPTSIVSKQTLFTFTSHEKQHRLGLRGFEETKILAFFSTCKNRN